MIERKSKKKSERETIFSSLILILIFNNCPYIAFSQKQVHLIYCPNRIENRRSPYPHRCLIIRLDRNRLSYPRYAQHYDVSLLYYRYSVLYKTLL